MTYDLEYTTNGLFTRFTPNTAAGVVAWNTIAAMNEGCANIFTAHLDATLKQLRAAGYSVGKARKVKLTLADILDGEDALLAELMA